MMQTILFQGIYQRSAHMLLALEFLEVGRSIFSGKNLITHGDGGRCCVKVKLYGVLTDDSPQMPGLL